MRYWIEAHYDRVLSTRDGRWRSRTVVGYALGDNEQQALANWLAARPEKDQNPVTTSITESPA